MNWLSRWKVINFLETTKHKAWVAWYMLKVCFSIIGRAIKHDVSKYSKYETPYFEKALPKLHSLEYGSDEYKQAISLLGPALKHHYQINSHHPEHWANRVEDMSPLDLIEMLCDWKAATRRHATGDFNKSLEINEMRFNYSSLRTVGFVRAAAEIGLMNHEFGKE